MTELFVTCTKDSLIVLSLMDEFNLHENKIVWWLMPFFTLYQLYRCGQFINPYFPGGFCFSSIMQNILLLAAFPSKQKSGV